MSLLDIRVTESGTVCVCRCEDCGKEFEQAPARKMAAECWECVNRNSQRRRLAAVGYSTAPFLRRWTEEEAELARSTLPRKVIAEMTGRTVIAVSRMRQRMARRVAA